MCIPVMATTNDVGTSKILEKGPEYLRKQLDLENEAKASISAVERLAATKQKYVKSHQVDYSTKELVNNVESVSVSSNGSSNQGSNLSGNLVPLATSTSVGKSGAQIGATHGDNVVRRTSSKKRDSLFLYRQKCDLLKVSTNGKNKNYLARKLLLGSLDKSISLPEATKECTLEDRDCKVATPEGNSTIDWTKQDSETKMDSCDWEKPSDKRVADVQRRSRNSVSRSHSDISSRYSKNFADFDAFFKYCGLDGEVIESLGKDNFSNKRSTKIRSISTSSSEDGFSRNSGDSDGLLEEELQETSRREISVIERNARVIKWLYSCKNATETGKKLRDLD